MAFENFIKTGTYSNVQRIYYCKQDKHISFCLSVYADNTKVSKIQEFMMSFNINTTWDSVIGILKTNPPEAPTIGDKYILGETPTGVWETFGNTLAHYSSEGWSYQSLGQNYFAEDTSKYYFNSNGALVEQVGVFDARTWVAYFEIDKIGSVNNSDLIKQIYTYLKTRTEFSEVTDC